MVIFSTLNRIRSTFALCFVLLPNLYQAKTVSVTVGGMNWDPVNVDVYVGDSIKWVLLAGVHTTTSLSIPDSAKPWDVLLNSGTPTYTYAILKQGVYVYNSTPHITMGMVAGTVNASINPTVSFTHFPSPFSEGFTVTYNFEKSDIVEVYTLLGTLVTFIPIESAVKSVYVKVDVASGIYIYAIRRKENVIETQKIIKS